jgi:hypothetical protein
VPFARPASTDYKLSCPINRRPDVHQAFGFSLKQAMADQPFQAEAIQPHEPKQGCLKVLSLTACRLFIHFMVLLLVVAVLVTPVRVFMRFFEQEDLKLPAITVLIVNLSHRMRFHSYIIVPALLFIDAFMLLLLQLPPRPWRFLARAWFSAVLLGAILLLAATVFAMVIPIDQMLPADARVFTLEPPMDPLPEPEQR